MLLQKSLQIKKNDLLNLTVPINKPTHKGDSFDNGVRTLKLVLLVEILLILSITYTDTYDIKIGIASILSFHTFIDNTVVGRTVLNEILDVLSSGT